MKEAAEVESKDVIGEPEEDTALAALESREVVVSSEGEVRRLVTGGLSDDECECCRRDGCCRICPIYGDLICCALAMLLSTPTMLVSLHVLASSVSEVVIWLSSLAGISIRGLTTQNLLLTTAE